MNGTCLWSDDNGRRTMVKRMAAEEKMAGRISSGDAREREREMYEYF